LQCTDRTRLSTHARRTHGASASASNLHQLDGRDPGSKAVAAKGGNISNKQMRFPE